MASPSKAFAKIQKAADAIRGLATLQPRIGLILGSGLGSIAEKLENATIIPYTDIPGFHGTSIEGHAGKLFVGRFQGVATAILQGRFHYYEGHSMEDVALPARTLCALGIGALILTNAAGGINTRYRPGDLMLIEDQLNLMGDNPLRGPPVAELGPRFPDLSEPYDRGLLLTLRKCADELSIPLHEGVYGGLAGPSYETPAEVRMLRALGADAVGMSTVPECIAANHMGVKVAGISCVTNLAAGLSPRKLTHREVIENSTLGALKLRNLLELAIPRLLA